MQHQQSTHRVQGYAIVAQKLVQSLPELNSGSERESERDSRPESELECENWHRCHCCPHWEHHGDSKQHHMFHIHNISDLDHSLEGPWVGGGRGGGGGGSLLVLFSALLMHPWAQVSAKGCLCSTRSIPSSSDLIYLNALQATHKNLAVRICNTESILHFAHGGAHVQHIGDHVDGWGLWLLLKVLHEHGHSPVCIRFLHATRQFGPGFVQRCGELLQSTIGTAAGTQQNPLIISPQKTCSAPGTSVCC